MPWDVKFNKNGPTDTTGKLTISNEDYSISSDIDLDKPQDVSSIVTTAKTEYSSYKSKKSKVDTALFNIKAQLG